MNSLSLHHFNCFPFVVLNLVNCFFFVGFKSSSGVHNSFKIHKWAKTAASISHSQPCSPQSNWVRYITGLGLLADMQRNLELQRFYWAARTKSWSVRIVPILLRLSVTITNVVLHNVVWALLFEIFVNILPAMRSFTIVFELTVPGLLSSLLCLPVQCPAQ